MLRSCVWAGDTDARTTVHHRSAQGHIAHDSFVCLERTNDTEIW